MGWGLLAFISLIWLGVVLDAVVKSDHINTLVYGGIFLTNTGLALLAFKSAIH